jgi:cytochrome c553
MSRFTLSCALMAAVAAPLPALALTLKTPAAADLPFGAQEFPPGPNVDAINSNCLTCHSVDHILSQPSLSRASWKEIVEKMVHGYKAPITPEDQEKIVNYLTSTKGLK